MLCNRNSRVAGAVWSDPGGSSNMMVREGCESAGPQIEKRFLLAVADRVVEALNIGWQDKTTVRNLLMSSLKDDMDDLLEQHVNAICDRIGRSLNSRLGIKEKPEYGFAIHAKLNNHIKKLKSLMKVPTDEKPGVCDAEQPEKKGEEESRDKEKEE